MIKRILSLIFTKFKYIFFHSIALSSRVEYSSVSRKAKVWGHCKVFRSSIDDYTYIGSHSRVIYAHIGKFCSIANNCAIGMGSHSINNISTSPIFTSCKNGVGISWTTKNTFEEYQNIEIGNDVWIGQRVMVMGGVKIGNGAVIGAGAIVTKDIPSYAIAVGVPAKVIKYRFSKEIIDELENISWWDYEDKLLKDNIAKFQDSDMKYSKIIRFKESLGGVKIN